MRPGIGAALIAALLFGAGTPLSKALLGQITPWMLAALLYLGSGIGLFLLRQLHQFRHSPPAKLERGDWRWFAGAVL